MGSLGSVLVRHLRYLMDPLFWQPEQELWHVGESITGDLRILLISNWKDENLIHFWHTTFNDPEVERNNENFTTLTALWWQYGLGTF
jgi:hypothetical protein